MRSRASRRAAAPALTTAVAGASLVVALAGCSGGGEPVDVTPTTSASASTSSSGTSAGSASGEGSSTAAPSTSASTAPSTTAPSTTAPGSASPQASASDVSVGGVVAGFPADVLPVPAGATVLLTSAVPAGDRLQVSLSGRTSVAPESVLETYRTSLVGAGFAESPSAGAPGALASTFTRGDGAELVSVVVVPDAQGGAAAFTVGGTVAAPAP